MCFFFKSVFIQEFTVVSFFQISMNVWKIRVLSRVPIQTAVSSVPVLMATS